ncbi:hypothetical protein NDU88_001035 [Pleurodeles waltl]|uniref:Uncharacterized protein n=1 Tax=Pleurodeles waltl TaxID=8319 RepID=A0AAV7V7D5_PLEWA|nr:hypothetical protein NDU88_001035 [Pleurodeles waltl]
MQSKRAYFLVVKRALHDEGISYTLLFPSRMKLMVDGNTHFCQDPEEAWARREKYKSGMDRSQLESAENTQRRKGRRRSRSRAQRNWLTKPTPILSEEEKLLVLHAAASLTETNVSDKEEEERSDTDHDTDARLSDSDSQARTPEDYPHVMPQSSEDII